MSEQLKTAGKALIEKAADHKSQIYIMLKRVRYIHMTCGNLARQLLYEKVTRDKSIT